ncbi:MAG: chemotaxis protein CheW [bacterium]
MGNNTQVIVFLIDNQSYAIPLHNVDRIIRAVEITPLPKAPETVSGVIDYHGTLIPVLSMRKRLNLAPREITANDRFILAKTGRRTVILIADEVAGLTEIPGDRIVPAKNIVKEPAIEGIIRGEDGIIYIYDLNTFFILGEEEMLDTAIHRMKKEK